MVIKSIWMVIHSSLLDDGDILQDMVLVHFDLTII